MIGHCVLPPVTRGFLGSSQTTNSATAGSSSTFYCTPSPISFGNPPSVSMPSVNIHLGDDLHNISGFLSTPNFYAQRSQQITMTLDLAAAANHLAAVAILVQQFTVVQQTSA